MGKKQHYIPKFYLKLFSNNGANTHIGLYNFKNRKFISSAGITNQAYEHFLYGEDNEIEEKFAELESEVKTIFQKLNSAYVLPNSKSKEFANIFVFTFLQLQRTVHAIEETNKGLDKLLESISPEEDKGKYELRIENPAIFNLQILVDALHTVTDLCCKLLVNRTNIPFITSDNPVIKYNQFLEKKGKKAGLTGLASKGLQIFYPITPTKMLIFYDNRVYKIGDRKKSIVETQNAEDIYNLNLLQTLDCSEQIFFNDKITEWYIEKLIEKRKVFYKPNREELDEYVVSKNEDGTQTELAHFYKYPIAIKLVLSFIRETDHAKQYKLSDFAVELRDERLRYPDKFYIPTVRDFL